MKEAKINLGIQLVIASAGVIRVCMGVGGGTGSRGRRDLEQYVTDNKTLSLPIFSSLTSPPKIVLPDMG